MTCCHTLDSKMRWCHASNQVSSRHLFDDRHFGYFSVFYVKNTKAFIIAGKVRARGDEVRR